MKNLTNNVFCKNIKVLLAIFIANFRCIEVCK